MSGNQVFCYIGRCSCGCGAIRGASVDLPAHKDETAKFVADLIRDGMQVERVPVETARAEFGECRAPKTQGELAL